MENDGKVNWFYENFQKYPGNYVDDQAENHEPDDNGISEILVSKKRLEISGQAFDNIFFIFINFCHLFF